jgi:hypothetical protein
MKQLRRLEPRSISRMAALANAKGNPASFDANGGGDGDDDEA